MYRKDKWWDDVSTLIAKVDGLYREAAAAGKPYTKNSISEQRIIEARNWTPSAAVIHPNFDRALSDLNCFYVPRTIQPGPMVVFPMKDVFGKYTRAQTKPLEGSVEFGPKYTYLGLRSKEFAGPSWLGNDPATLAMVIAQRRVVLVEGPFDLLACRLAAPDTPSMCPLTKSLGHEHQAYLRMLGVDTLYLMFDNEKPKDEKYDIGGGELSMRALQRDVKEMKVEILYCPASDPSKALETYVKARQLKTFLANL